MINIKERDSRKQCDMISSYECRYIYISSYFSEALNLGRGRNTDKLMTTQKLTSQSKQTYLCVMQIKLQCMYIPQ